MWVRVPPPAPRKNPRDSRDFYVPRDALAHFTGLPLLCCHGDSRGAARKRITKRCHEHTLGKLFDPFDDHGHVVRFGTRMVFEGKLVGF